MEAYLPYLLALVLFPLAIILQRYPRHPLRLAIPLVGLPIFLISAYLDPERMYTYLLFAFFAIIFLVRPPVIGTTGS